MRVDSHSFQIRKSNPHRVALSLLKKILLIIKPHSLILSTHQTTTNIPLIELSISVEWEIDILLHAVSLYLIRIAVAN